MAIVGVKGLRSFRNTATNCFTLERLMQEIIKLWTPRGSGRRRGRPTKTWRSTFKKCRVDRGVDWNSVRAVATNRSRWRTLAAHWPVKDQRI